MVHDLDTLEKINQAAVEEAGEAESFTTKQAKKAAQKALDLEAMEVLRTQREHPNGIAPSEHYRGCPLRKDQARLHKANCAMLRCMACDGDKAAALRYWVEVAIQRDERLNTPHHVLAVMNWVRENIPWNVKRSLGELMGVPVSEASLIKAAPGEGDRVLQESVERIVMWYEKPWESSEEGGAD